MTTLKNLIRRFSDMNKRNFFQKAIDRGSLYIFGKGDFFAMEFAKILEAMMLIIFGASWPAQILKTIRAKNPQGKSFLFLYMILTGYACGLASKFVGGTWRGNWIIYLYMLDLLMVGTDTVLSHYYLRRLKRISAQE